MHKRGIAPHDHTAIGKLECGTTENPVAPFFIFPCLLGGFAGGNNHGARFGFRANLLEQQLGALDGFAIGAAKGVFAAVAEIAPDDFLDGGFPHRFVVDNRKACAVHAHVRG